MSGIGFGRGAFFLARSLASGDDYDPPVLRQLAGLHEARVGHDKPPVRHVPLDGLGLRRVLQLIELFRTGHLRLMAVQGHGRLVEVRGHEVRDPAAVRVAEAGVDLLGTLQLTRATAVHPRA